MYVLCAVCKINSKNQCKQRCTKNDMRFEIIKSCKLKPLFLSEKADANTSQASDLDQYVIDHRIT